MASGRHHSKPAKRNCPTRLRGAISDGRPYRDSNSWAGNELLAAALAWLNPRFLSEFYPNGTSHFKCELNPGVACELADRGGSISRALRQTLLHRRFS
jgi:hypothetical protein